jgi:antitoxin Phd
MNMMVDTKNLVPMTEANQNFSRVVRMVDESGLAVILKNNKPRYIVVDFGEYEQIQTLRALRARQIGQEADRLLEENQEAFRELAK